MIDAESNTTTQINNDGDGVGDNDNDNESDNDSSIDAESDIGTEMNLRIAGLNCNGLLNKVDSLLASANEPHSDWNIICVQETHETLYQKLNQQLQRQGWAFYSSTIHDHEHENDSNDLFNASGGTGIYVANSLTDLWSIEQHETNTDRITHISLSDDDNTIHIFSVYAADSSKRASVRKQIYNNMNDALQRIAAHQDARTHTYIIQGDWNTSPLSYNSNTPMFNEFVETHQFRIMHNDLPTFIRGTSNTLIDHFLISPSLLHLCTAVSVLVSDDTVTSPGSDHRTISIHLV